MNTKKLSQLSNRARNCLVRLLYAYEWGKESKWYLDLDTLNPEELKKLLLDKFSQPPHTGRSVKQALLLTKNCGRRTTHEILTWIGMSNGHELHVCVCRYCDRVMP
jgi:hypothetical protein